MKVKQALDQLFDGVSFDKALYDKLHLNNIQFITKNEEHKNLFGSKLIGCFMLKYTEYDKNIFYDNLFGIDIEEVRNAIEQITTIQKHFKIARDDVNLVTFYMAHRFLSNPNLTEEKATQYAEEALNYFNYRTLVLTSSDFFIYPISEEKAVSLSERLSNRYVIKQVKNWAEYCQYRSSEYLKTRMHGIVKNFTSDTELPNAITDLYSRTKDTLKNIYGEFDQMLRSNEVIKSRSTVANDIEGEEVVLDRLNTVDSYFTKIEALMTDKSSFIKKEMLDVTTDIVNTVSYKALEDTLHYTLEYSYTNKVANDKVKNFIKGVLINATEYLRRNKVYLAKGTNVLQAINHIVGNLLHARSVDAEINTLKEDGDKLIKDVYKFKKELVTERNTKNLRNAFYVYIVLTMIV